MTISIHFVRKLGHIENFFTAITKVGRYNNFSYIVELDKELIKEEIHYSISKLVKENPLLAALVVEDSIYLPDEVVLSDVFEDWGELIFDELFPKVNEFKFEFSPTCQSFRIIRAGKKLVFIMNHALFDGGSAISLSKHFVSNIGSKSSDVQSSIYQYSPSHSIPPPLESVLNYKANIPNRLTSELPSYSSGITSYQSPHYFRTKIIKKRKLDISLTTKIQSSWVQALLSHKEFSKECQYDTCFGVDSRRWIQSPSKYGCYSTGYFQSIDPNVDPVKYSDELRNDVKTSDILQPYMIYATSGLDWEKEFGTGYQEKPRGCLEITNMGKVDQNSWFVQSTFDLSFVFGINVVTVGDELKFVFTMVDNEKICTKLWESIIDKFEYFINH